MKLEVASLSDVGQVRHKNEDSMGYFEPRDETQRGQKGFIFIVADGMGGHRGGEIASRLAVETVIAAYYASEETDTVEALAGSYREANRAIIERSHSEVDLFGMGTTCTTMVVKDGEAFFAHVGDSRAYVLRDDHIKQLTEDHSLVGEMVRSGILSNEDAQRHPKRNVITRSLGTQEEIAADFPESPYVISEGDVFLLCSDGLTSLIDDGEVGNILRSHDPKEACRALVDSANNKGGKDNITVQVIKVHQR
jgi:protein phosphatase